MPTQITSINCDFFFAFKEKFTIKYIYNDKKSKSLAVVHQDVLGEVEVDRNDHIQQSGSVDTACGDIICTDVLR